MDEPGCLGIMHELVAIEFGATEDVEGITGLGGRLKGSLTLWLLYVSLKSMVPAAEVSFSLIVFPLILEVQTICTPAMGL